MGTEACLGPPTPWNLSPAFELATLTCRRRRFLPKSCTSRSTLTGSSVEPWTRSTHGQALAPQFTSFCRHQEKGSLWSPPYQLCRTPRGCAPNPAPRSFPGTNARRGKGCSGLARH